MAPRFTEEEKGKKHMKEAPRENIKRIKAPNLDNSDLIADNALTLIGRLTNPQEQRIWALIPALTRKWNLQGRAEGSDLGNNCFQFRFERQDDLQKVLENRPYQFAYWMVIIQQWEPVISRTFPSAIPFWIRIKGIPLHYWHGDTVRRVGQELGTYEKHELTRTTARVRVLVDGLKPLIKESILEFDFGEESLLTLEYERLELHCSYCYSLLHLKRNCPEKQREEATRTETPEVLLREARTSDHVLLDSKVTSSFNLTSREHSRGAKEASLHTSKRNDLPVPSSLAFRERVDRHGNPFGTRVGTKQTRNPPPATMTDLEDKTQQIRHKTQENPQQEDSTSLFRNRERTNRPAKRNIDIFPRRSEGQ